MKKFSRQNYSSLEDIQIDFELLFDRTRNFSFNRKKHYHHCTKSMRDTKQLIISKRSKNQLRTIFYKKYLLNYLSKTFLSKSKIQFSRQNIRD